MRSKSCLFAILTGFFLFSFLSAKGFTGNPLEDRACQLAKVWEHFPNPPAAFRPAPLYVWNDDIEEEELARQLDGFKEQGFGGVFIHPRPGLITPYLSKRWLELWRFTLEECKKRGMFAYIYDENSYPSGFAGGFVPHQMPESRLVYLRQEIFPPEKVRELKVHGDTVALYCLAGGKPSGRIKLIVDSDGRSGSLFVHGLGASKFLYKGNAFEGGIGFRAIAGRNCKIDDVRFYQVQEDGKVVTLLEDDFNRDSLGSHWVNESITPGVDAGRLKARIEKGLLVLEHDGTMNDAWLRPAKSALFVGRTTIFEFTLVERFGNTSCNPALVAGTKPYQGSETNGVMLIDIRGYDPVFDYGMVNGEWERGQAAPRYSEDRFAGLAFDRVELPSLSKGESLTAQDLGLEAGTYLHHSLEYGGASPWYGGKFFVDLLRPGVGEKFLEVTFGAYDSILAGEYGKTVLACFTDEPHIAGCWTPSLPEAFQALWGYSILDHLPSIHRSVGEWRKVRHDYAVVLLKLYLENFVKPYSRACEERKIAFTGHVWEHGWPGVGHGPDVMSFNARQHAPGIDCLMNQYSEGPNAQFGNTRAVAEIRSIANQCGRVRTLCEAYGAAGWETTFQDLKRIGDWLCVSGVNLLNPHLSFYTIRGARKADHPPSFSYHEPWWEAYHILADYFGRLCWVLSSGRECNELLVIEPTTTMWMYNWDPSSSQRLNDLGSQFQRYVTELAAAQVPFDLGSEPVMAERGRAEEGRCIVGECSYSTVVLPPGLENLEESTVQLLKRFAGSGGRIVSHVGVPPFVSGRKDGRVADVKEKAEDRWISLPSFPSGGFPWISPKVRVRAKAPKGGRVFHLVRELDDGFLLFVVNTSLEEGAEGSAEAAAGSVEHWDLREGISSPASFTRKEARPGTGTLPGIQWDFALPPAGSALFAISFEEKASWKKGSEEKPGKRVEIEPKGRLEIRMLEPNVLPLDFMDLVLQGERINGLYRYEAQTRVYQAHGFERNCWDRAVQFEDELIRRDRFPEETGFVLEYPFLLGDFEVPPGLELVVEQGGRYKVSLNGHLLSSGEGKWWLDRSFTVFPIEPEWLEKGRNVIRTEARPFSIHHEPEPVYLLGDFALRSAEQGWILEPPKELALGPWSRQGLPCYPGQVAYTQAFECRSGSARHFVEFIDWSGTVARVDVNGKRAGYIGWQPWRLEITDHVRTGENRVTVVIFGSLKNLLGPHHSGPVRGSAWPGSFLHSMEAGQPPGDRYDVIEYGLKEPFVLYWQD